MRVSANDVVKQKEESKKSASFGSMWNPGDTGIVFYPFFRDEVTGNFELLAAGIRGHQINDTKAIPGIGSFIPSLCQFDEDNNIIGAGDITYQFSRIAPCFIVGAKELELNDARSKQGIDETTRHQLIQDIESKYDTKNINSIKPVIGGLTYYISTEAVYVPMKDSEPLTSEARLVSQKLSDKKIKTLMTIAKDPKYEPVFIEGSDGLFYLEVQYSWPVGKKQEAGQADPVGLTAEYRLESTHAQQFKAIMNELSKLPSESETIEKRGWGYVKVSESAVRQRIKNYSIMQTASLDALSETTNEEMIKRIEKNAALCKDLNILDNLHNQVTIDKLRAAIELQAAQEDTEKSALITKTTEADSLPSSEAPSLDEMLRQEHIGSEDVLSQIDDGE